MDKDEKQPHYADPAVQAVLEAWIDSGINPAYHRAMQMKLRKEWPVLAQALDHLIPAKGSHG